MSSVGRCQRLRGLLVPAAFLVAALSTAGHAWDAVSIAGAHTDPGHVLVAIHALLRTGVAVAFALFTVGRAAPLRPVRDPVVFVVCAFVMIAPVALTNPSSRTLTALLIAGVAVAVAGTAWLLVSVLVLGRCFGVLPAARGLVLRGPYRVVRHPVYLGELVAMAGLAIAVPLLANLVLVTAVLAAQLVRMRLEEQALSDAFPEYASYANRTRALVPLPRRSRSRPVALPFRRRGHASPRRLGSRVELERAARLGCANPE
jgi:protein-S-isoprenylcysteine O-methyltransferase Ste14